MTTIFPLLAALLAVLSLVVSGIRKPGPTSALGHLVAVGVCALSAAIAFRFRTSMEATGVAEGLAIGMAGAMAASHSSRRALTICGSTVSAFAWGVAAGGALRWLNPGSAAVIPMSALLGCGITAVILDVAEDSFASLAALAFACVACADFLDSFATLARTPGHTGTVVGLAVPGLGLVGVALDRYGTGWTRNAVPLLLVIVFSGAGWFLARQWPDLREAVKLVPIACAAGVAVHWMMPAEGDSSALRLGLSIIIWCALATFAFGMMKSLGVALALMAASSTLLLLGNSRALASLAPLIALTFYRVFRTLHADTYQAIDLGQHYALVGFILGALAVALPLEWLRTHPYGLGRRAMLGMGVWSFCLLAAPAIVGLMLGERGMIGFLVGLGMSPLIAGWHDRRSLGVLSSTAALGGLTVLSFGWLTDYLDLARDEKVRYFGYAAALIVACGVVLALLARGGRKEAAN